MALLMQRIRPLAAVQPLEGCVSMALLERHAVAEEDVTCFAVIAMVVAAPLQHQLHLLRSHLQQYRHHSTSGQ